MDDIEEMREEVRYLRTLAALNTDARVGVEIQLLIEELERRIREGGNGNSTVLPPRLGYPGLGFSFPR